MRTAEEVRYRIPGAGGEAAVPVKEKALRKRITREGDAIRAYRSEQNAAGIGKEMKSLTGNS